MDGICVLQSKNNKVKGYITFKETKRGMKIICNIAGLEPGLHGFHIHRTGNLLLGCTSLCDHFNPTNSVHGSRTSKERHLGDLGNIKANQFGEVVNKTIFDKHLKLFGKFGIIGRSVVIHEDEDDLGLGGLNSKGHITNAKIRKESLITGNAGKRIACGVIGIK